MSQVCYTTFSDILSYTPGHPYFLQLIHKKFLYGEHPDALQECCTQFLVQIFIKYPKFHGVLNKKWPVHPMDLPNGFRLSFLGSS